MAQETITPEAQTPTTLVVEETVVFPALEAIAKKVSKTSADDARTILGEDSVTDFAFNGTLTVGSQTAIIDETGTIEIGASCPQSNRQSPKQRQRPRLLLPAWCSPPCGSKTRP